MAPQASTQTTGQTLRCPQCGSHGYITDVHISHLGRALAVDVVIQCLEYQDHEWHVRVIDVIGSSGLAEETALHIGPTSRPA
jgi:hypothetical protein